MTYNNMNKAKSSEAAQVIQLARSVGLKGFDAPEDAGATRPANDQESDASEVVALARRVGLKGFE